MYDSVEAESVLCSNPDEYADGISVQMMDSTYAILDLGASWTCNGLITIVGAWVHDPHLGSDNPYGIHSDNPAPADFWCEI